MAKAKEAHAKGTSLLAARQRLILWTDKSDFGWKTVHGYVQQELAVDKEDGIKIRCAKEMAEKAVKSTVARKAARRAICSPDSLLVTTRSCRGSIPAFCS